MTRGTILLIGPKAREAELLAARLEKENFSVIHCVNQESVASWLKRGTAQLVLFTHACSRRFVEDVLRRLHGHKRTKHTPAILVTDEEIPEKLQDMKGIGETFRLHRISLAEAIHRLQLAIQLSQLAK
jgi:DNA-binding response OmpR family regulator